MPWMSWLDSRVQTASPSQQPPYIQELTGQEVRRSKRSNSPLTLLMIDVDHFKTFNDTHGHPAGDRVLRRVADILKKSLRTTDIVARYGGEEFAVLLVDTPLSLAAKAADKVRTAIRSTTFEGAAESQPNGRITVSIGMAGWPMRTDCTRPDRAADTALYAAKKAGRSGPDGRRSHIMIIWCSTDTAGLPSEEPRPGDHRADTGDREYRQASDAPCSGYREVDLGVTPYVTASGEIEDRYRRW